MSDTFKPPRAPRDIPRLSEIEGYLVAFEAFQFDMVKSYRIDPDAPMMERMACRITVLAPPAGSRHMAVAVDGREHVIPAAFGTREAPIYTSSTGLIAACKRNQPAIGRAYLSQGGARRWWTLWPASVAEHTRARRTLAELGSDGESAQRRDAYLRGLGYPGYNRPHPDDRPRGH